MKRLVILFIVGLMGLGSASAQKFAYVDTEYILSQLPEYRSAQKKLNELSETWQKEIESMYEEVDKMAKDYQAEKIMLTGDMQKKREQEIIEKERQIKNYQQEKFGYEGELFKKRQELIKPIQDKVYVAIQSVAKADNLDFIFDKSGEMIMLFSNARYDKSDDVLAELGVTPQTGKQPGRDPDLPPEEDDDQMPPR